MGFKFNPLTGNLDLVNAASAPVSSGDSFFPSAQTAGSTYTVGDSKQVPQFMPCISDDGASIVVGDGSVIGYVD